MIKIRNVFKQSQQPARRLKRCLIIYLSSMVTFTCMATCYSLVKLCLKITSLGYMMLAIAVGGIVILVMIDNIRDIIKYRYKEQE